ncbi:MAG TPA: hypothetical protein VIF09_00525 [Polyangiaceae bacterium]
MAESAPRRRWSLGRWRSLFLVAVGWSSVYGLQRYDAQAQQLHGFRLEDVAYRVLSGFPSLAHLVAHVIDMLTSLLAVNLMGTVGVATLLLPLAFAVRLVARARVRAGHADPLDGVRRWNGTRRGAIALSTALPVLWQTFLLAEGFRWAGNNESLWLEVLVAGVVVFGFGQVRVARAGLRELLAPTLPSTDVTAPEVSPDEIRFAAVAVTRETKAAVASLAALTLGMVAFVATRPIAELFRDPRVLTAIAAYVGVAAVGALAFRRASRISVGLDGIYVGGTSRRRFYPYRDVEQVRVRGGDIELVRRDAVVLRLQLHGEDAARREAIVARIEEALARVKEVERDAAAHFVTSRSAKKVSDAAQGRVDYRMPAVSEDALWALVEGSGVDAATRTAAAEALAHRGKTVDRDRFRVAAAHCAEPKVRVVLEELGAEEQGEVREVADGERRSASV